MNSQLITHIFEGLIVSQDAKNINNLKIDSKTLMSKPKKYFLLVVSLIITTTVFSQVQLPKLISDGMVLQRDTKVKIWGWSAPNEKIEIFFKLKRYKITANNQGQWELTLLPMKAGGPYVMKIEASNSIEINNILIGEVWLCSGESNMAMAMDQVSDLYEDDIANSENTFIRSFQVPREYDFIAARNDFNGGSWKETNPDDIMQFSATAYFFAKELYNKLKIPIGLIHASRGGTPAEAWMSEEALKPFPEAYNQIKLLKNPSYIQITNNRNQELEKKWNSNLILNDKGVTSNNNWTSNSTNTSDWGEIKIPGLWKASPLGKIYGVVWYKKEIEVSKNIASNESVLRLGTIIGADSTYVNGKLIGSVNDEFSPRIYKLPANFFNKGKNIITVRLVSKRGNGGFVSGMPYEILGNNESINLAGIWKYKLGAKLDSLPQPTIFHWNPTGLYNAMIEPLKKYIFKGVILYQGEANAQQPVKYGKIFPALIFNWRALFNLQTMPFLYVQLPNYMESKELPSESNWALLREAQSKTLFVTNTGMATTIDVGEGNNIHPPKKKEVGTRLALLAQNLVYGDKNVICYGPKYESMQIENDKIVLSFSTSGSGLQFKGVGTHTNFAIAGEDKKFVWAKAKIENGKITVWSKEILNPVAVRYAWADNPEGEKLFNTEGLPASPFRTDSW